MRPVTCRVALVEDHTALAEALHVSLSLKGFQVMGVPLTHNESTAALLESIQALTPDVVLLDLDLGVAGDGARLVNPLTRSGLRVVILTASSDPSRWGECVAQGAAGVLGKTTPLMGIVRTLERTVQGMPVMPRTEREELIELWFAQHADDSDRRRRLNLLTSREAHVLGELARGKRVREVATDSFVSEATVRTQVKAILAKLGVTSQLAAVALVREEGWTPGTPPDARPQSRFRASR